VSAPTFEAVEAESNPLPLPTCAPWCAFHEAPLSPEDPGPCWTEDVDVPVPDPQGGPDRQITVMSTYDATRQDRPVLSITLFPVRETWAEGVSFTSVAEAEASAYALLAVCSAIRGDDDQAAANVSAALTAAGGGL
jgi:hypothetical protein